MASLSCAFVLQRIRIRSVVVRADAFKLDVEPTLIVQEHAGTVTVDRTVGEQHADGESSLYVFRQFEEGLMGIPVRVIYHGGVRHISIAVSVFVHVSHERQIPGVVLGELCLEVLYLGQRVIADSKAFGHCIGFVRL
ncbi:Hypothetical protein BS27_1351 [Bifidobacterium breve S27]|nr:Hypothetical protein BS27_1351 [Bifidobacterium breve S27]